MIVGTISVLTVVSIDFWRHSRYIESGGGGGSLATGRVASRDRLSLVKSINAISTKDIRGVGWNLPSIGNGISLASVIGITGWDRSRLLEVSFSSIDLISNSRHIPSIGNGSFVAFKGSASWNRLSEALSKTSIVWGVWVSNTVMVISSVRDILSIQD